MAEPTSLAAHDAADHVLASQSVFRAALDAMAHPGRIAALLHAPATVGAAAPAALALLATLADGDTPVWLDQPTRAGGLAEHLRFHCGCPIVDEPARCAFALVTEAERCPPLAAFDPGTSDYPDRSATVIVQVSELQDGRGVRLTGPGIETAALLEAAPLPGDFWAQITANADRFPLGIDVILASGRRLAALPRTVKVEG
jgi:alpha-D-ribose 1-methylphosphonate 5-triphosphate synthase subunit PhnH